MKETTRKLEQLINSGQAYLSHASEEELCKKSSTEKWSKKEILGHLIDSGINNLQRFTEIQFENKPYKIKKYNQDALVIANNYQNASPQELAEFWLSVNNRIKNIIESQTEVTLNYAIELGDENFSDLRFLINDYVEHLEHHLNQIKNTNYSENTLASAN
ncbi:DinB family protein [Aureibacter tunicatorum]|uniref:DinB-like domain-containing protein n=1 Tax=Aureibacter tunicatorum TaxID=866807 RepID=A0AAE3XL65_9BACT|nr:DinB family protein [Aureibacter tunicatorum]MDR6238550.1 hypothetical protein [Aureibacter tunicatorum]BDD05519.1 hypothetical protein AUTU_30020 [Aureibacter tunicatorum]